MNKKLICTAVGASLALSAGLTQAAYRGDYNFGFVPYVVKDTNRTTLVSVIMDSDDGGNASDEIMHVQYWTKSTTAANTAACDPSSVTVPVTANDIVTFDTAGILGYPLFGDKTNPAPLGMSISYSAPRHGFLFIESPQNRDGELGINAVFWLELDLANGGAHGDAGAVTDTQDLATEFENNDILEAYPVGDLGSSVSGASPVVFWPSSVASTAFTVTPLGTDMLNRENNQAVMQVFNDNQVQGAYDRNENGVDGTVPVTVRCVGRLTPAQLMPGVVANAAWAAQGGWGYLANLGDGDTVSDETQNATNSGDNDVWVYQIDSAAAGGKFMTNATKIRSDYD